MPVFDIFCDGAAPNNGRKTAKAGYGVALFIDKIPATKYSIPLGAGEPQTNQRAELQAFYHAMQIVAEKKVKTTIYTDSMYSINCVTVWGPKWKAAGWVKADKKEIQHLDILKPMIALYEELGPLVSVRHVRGHQKAGSGYEADGNSLADELATAAAATPT